MRTPHSILAIGLICCATVQAQTPQENTPAPRTAAGPAYKYVLAPKPRSLPSWAAPNRPHWKLADILKAHAGQKSWTQTLVRDKEYVANYIQMAPGEASKTRMYAQTSTFWIVQAGRMQVFIEGQEPFIASKGFVVCVPYRRLFHMETVGAEPSLRFEVSHASAPALYALDETPSPLEGQKYVKSAYAGAPGSYGSATKPYVDFNTEIIQQGGNNLRFLAEGNFLRGQGVPMPPDSDKGHFHTDHNEFWFVMEGQTNFKFEGMPAFTAGQGDVVYAPRGRFHRPSFAGAGTSTRLSIAPTGNMAALDPDSPTR
jgi:mannose-6-phosphate isomerase-like protein (cupin superfamily)